MSDPYAAFSRPVKDADPYAAIARPVAAKPAPKPKAAPKQKPAPPARAQPRTTTDAQADAAARDIASSDGFFDRMGDLFSRGMSGLNEGLYRLGGVAQDFNQIKFPGMSDETHARNVARSVPIQQRLRADANAQRRIGATPIENETTIDDVLAAPSPASIGKFIAQVGVPSLPSVASAAISMPQSLPQLGKFVAESGVQSLPHMAAAALNLPTLIASQTGNIGQRRADNDGREDISMADAAIAAPVATISGLAEALGITRILKPIGRTVTQRVLGAAGTEGALETGQSTLEYSGGTVGTEAGFDPAEAGKQAVAGGLTGAGVGAVGRGVVEAPAAVRAGAAKAKELARKQPDPEPGALIAPSDYDAFSTPVVASGPEAQPVPVVSAPAPAPPQVDPQPAAAEPVTIGSGDAGGLGTPAPVEPAPPEAPAEPVAPLKAVQNISGMLANSQGSAPEVFTTQREAAKFLAENSLAGRYDIATNPSGEGFVLKNAYDDPSRKAAIIGARQPTAPKSEPAAPTPEPVTKPVTPAPEPFAPKPPAELGKEDAQRGYKGGPPDVFTDEQKAEWQSAYTAALAPAAKPAPLEGPRAEKTREVRTPAGNTITTRMGVVESTAPTQAEGANQNRDRSRETTDLQVQEIIAKFDPAQLAEDPSTDRGAPIIGPDGAIDSGNGRMIALNKIYDQYPELAAKYRSMIEAQGFDTTGMARPVLVQHRETDFTPEQRRAFVIESNKDTKLTLTATEKARGDADLITPEMLATYAGGDLNGTANAGFVQAFNKQLTSGEMGGMIGFDRRLTTEGSQRIENALVAAAYGKPKLLERMMESTNNDIRSITGSLADVAGPWARLRAAAKAGEIDTKYDITDDLADAAARVSDARKSDTKPADIIAQSDAFDRISPNAEQFVRAFYNPAMTRAASRKAVTEFLNDYIKAAQSAKATEGLFGPEPAKAPDAILRDLLEARDNPNGDGLQLDALDTKENTDVDAGNKATGNAPRSDRSGAVRPEKEEDREGEARRDSAVRQRDGKADDVAEDKPDYAEDRSATLEDRGPYDPDFATASFTNRTSIFNSAAEALGLDPDAFTLMPAPRQVTLLQRAIMQKFGVAITVDARLQERFAIDQMLDAFQNVQGMAHVLDLPARAISLAGKLRLKFVKGARFLGAFSSGENLILLPKRSNSFAHEWGHALDYYLLDLVGGDGKGLTGKVRKEGSADVSADIRASFVALLDAMFFDKAGQAQKIMQLEAKIAQTKSAKVKAEAQAQLKRLRDGNSQARDIRSAFYKGAASFDGPGGDYWTSPTEMFARAFEAYVSYKVEAAGLTTEFIGKGDAGYLSMAEERFAKTFPKGEERHRIFAAFERLFADIGDATLLGPGAGAAKPEGSVRRLSDYSKTPKVAKEGGIIAREIAAIRRDARQAAKEIEGRGDSPKGTIEKAKDLNGVLFMSMTGNLRMIQGRSGSKGLQKLIDHLTKQDGRGDRTVARTFAEDVRLQSHATRNKVTNILKANKIDLEGRSADEDMMLRDLLTGSLNPDGTAGPNAPEGYVPEAVPPANFVKAAAAIRHILDEEFYVNQRAGIDLGYTRNGYLQRVLDTPKVWHDERGFKTQAAKVYEIVFDNEFGKGDEAAALLADEKRLPRFLKLGIVLAKQGHDIPSLAPVRALLKKINQLAARAAKAEGDVADGLNGQVDKLTADLEELMGELHGEIRPAFAIERASAWLAKINLVAGEEHNASSPDSKYIKSRKLPPEADKLMEKFYVSDPIEGVTNYLVQSARRTAYARRFGPKSEVRKKLFEQMAAEGVTPEDQYSVERILDIATGRTRSTLPQALQSGLAFINAAGTMILLPRATLSSLAEPFTSTMVTGNVGSGWKLMGMMIGSALGSPSGKVRFEMARALGIVEDAGSGDVMMARYAQTFADATRWDRYTAKMFQATGLTALTRAQKTHAIGLGDAFLDNNLNAIADRGDKNAIALMRELGIRDPETFAREWLARGGPPSVEELDSEFGQDYATAQVRFSDMVIQNPDPMDRPEMSQNPVGRVIYAITGFSYAFWRNIIKRNGILVGQTFKRDKGKAALYSSALFAGAATMFLMQLTVSTIREYLLNPTRWEDLEEKGELESTMVALGLSRTFPLGAADPAIQAYTGLKYQRDLANMAIGPGPGVFAKGTQDILMMRENSRGTNTGERNAIKGAYTLASPLVAFGIARIPGGPLINVAKGAAIPTVTSSAARDGAATFIVGPKQGKGEREASAFDEFMNAWRPEEPKEPEGL